jgi:sulfotransferase family protein
MDHVAANLSAWTPIHVRTNGIEPLVDWALIDGAFTDPFFEQTVARAMQHPFNQAFRIATPLDALRTASETAPALQPAGFIFHMSRCGSTVMAQMLSQMSRTIVLSEAQPIDALLRLRRRRGPNDESDAALLQNLMRALGQPRAKERRLFVKFHAWHVLELPFLARVFPGVPWVFLFRQPRQVLSSQQRAPGVEVLNGVLDAPFFDCEPLEAARIAPDEYAARTLAAFSEAALRHAGIGRGAFVEYGGDPRRMFSAITECFGIDVTADDAQRAGQISQADTKRNDTTFAARDDVGTAPSIDRLAAEWLDDSYASLRSVSQHPR